MAGVLIIHGTGVREDKYSSFFSLVRDQFVAHKIDVPVHACYWGDFGAAAATGVARSVPMVTREAEALERSQADKANKNTAGRWALLYMDPLFELRTLGQGTADPAKQVAGQLPPEEVLANVLMSYTPGETVAPLVQSIGLPAGSASLTNAVAMIAASQEFTRAAQASQSEDLSVRRAIARAITAMLCNESIENGKTLDGSHRDQLAEALYDELDAVAMGLGSDLGWAALRWAATALGRSTEQFFHNRRGRMADDSMALSGDILRYQARGHLIRDLIANRIKDTGATVLLGHSLGGIAAVDLLVMRPTLPITGLITVGSQAPYLYEIGALVSLDRDQQLPEGFPPWLNIFDRSDLLSFEAAPVFPATDVEVDNGQPFPVAHSAYFTHDPVWGAIKDFV